MQLSQKTKKILKIVLKALFSIAAILFVFSKIDINQVLSVISHASIPFLIGAIFIYVGSQVLSAMRVNTMIATLPLPLGTLMNIRLYWLGMFYNFFLPGGVGGDGYKVYYLNKHYKQPAKSLIFILLGDRLSGMAAIIIYLLLFASFFIEKLNLPLREYYFLLIPFVLLGYYLFLYFTKRSACKAFWRVLSFSMVIQGLQMCTATFILLALHGEIDDTESYMFLFLISSIASAIPISVAGVGIREFVFVYGSAILGTDPAIAVSLSILFYLSSLISALPGIAYVFRPSLIEGSHHHRGSSLYHEE